MSASVPKLVAAVMGVTSVAVAGFYLWQMSTIVARFPVREKPRATASVPEHGEKTADAHGAPAADAHGAPPADAHGAPPATDAHGNPTAAAAAPAASSVSVVSLDEIFVNVGDAASPVRSLGLKLELELFGAKERTLLEKREAGIKNTIIQASREQTFQKLSSVQGKLVFKELLVSRINDYLQSPAVRDIHFSSFFLQ